MAHHYSLNNISSTKQITNSFTTPGNQTYVELPTQQTGVDNSSSLILNLNKEIFYIKVSHQQIYLQVYNLLNMQ